MFWGCVLNQGLSADGRDSKTDSEPLADVSSWRASACDGVALRLKGTFMEAMQINEEQPNASMKRSWSEGDLQAFREAMEDCEIG
eukprot:2080936-Amphidinium_carterae.2